MSSIGIIGGTGPAGGGLALRLADIGFDVIVGSRTYDRVVDSCASLCGRWPDRTLQLDPGDNAMAAKADLVVVATPWDSAAATVRPLADELAGKVVISMANALVRADGEMLPLVVPRGSVAADVQAAAPTSHVVAGLHHIPARELGALDAPVDADVLICSDHLGAAATCAEVLGRIPGLRVYDVGRLSNATALEAFTSVLLQLNGHYGGHAGIRITGLEPHA